MSEYKHAPGDRNRTRHMFNTIASRYDFINRLLSLRRDVAWRNKLAASLPPREHLRVLDVATGTGDVVRTLLHQSSGASFVAGVDISEAMLGRARQKLKRAGLSENSALAATDAAALCFPDATFDVATVAFGVRNFGDLEAGLREIKRVLREGGQLLILEFSLPANSLMRACYLAYFRYVLPRVAGWISRRPDAYRYLNTTVEAFPYGAVFADILYRAGFDEVTCRPLSFGIATLYSAINHKRA